MPHDDTSIGKETRTWKGEGKEDEIGGNEKRRPLVRKEKEYSADIQSRIDAVEGHKYEDDAHDDMMKVKMKDHPEYRDQLINGVWWDVRKQSVFRWSNYDNQEKTGDYFWIISRNFVDGTVDVNRWPMK